MPVDSDILKGCASPVECILKTEKFCQQVVAQVLNQKLSFHMFYSKVELSGYDL